MSEYMEQRVEIVEDYCPKCGYAKCRCAETIFTGRYDNQPRMQMWLNKAFQLRQACRAQSHKLGELKMNLATNIMECSHCGESFDMNDLVSPELRVPRRVA